MLYDGLLAYRTEAVAKRIRDVIVAAIETDVATRTEGDGGLHPCRLTFLLLHVQCMYIYIYIYLYIYIYIAPSLSW